MKQIECRVQRPRPGIAINIGIVFRGKIRDAVELQ
jgi:hypothetical protein